MMHPLDRRISRLEPSPDSLVTGDTGAKALLLERLAALAKRLAAAGVVGDSTGAERVAAFLRERGYRQ